MPLSGPGGGWGSPGTHAPSGSGRGTPGGGSSWGGINWADLAWEFGQGAYGAYSARQANRAARRGAQKQMDFQERMSSTAYQRSADDLEKAGLNRILALGQPATTPGGAQPPKMEVQGRHAREGIATALQVGLIKAQIRRTDAETAFTKSKTGIAEPGKEIAETVTGAIQSAKGLGTRIKQELAWGPPKARATLTPSIKTRGQLDARERTYQPDKTPQQNMTYWMEAVKKSDGKYPTKTEIDKYWKWLLQQQRN